MNPSSDDLLNETLEGRTILGPGHAETAQLARLARRTRGIAVPGPDEAATARLNARFERVLQGDRAAGWVAWLQGWLGGGPQRRPLVQRFAAGALLLAVAGTSAGAVAGDSPLHIAEGVVRFTGNAIANLRPGGDNTPSAIDATGTPATSTPSPTVAVTPSPSPTVTPDEEPAVATPEPTRAPAQQGGGNSGNNGSGSVRTPAVAGSTDTPEPVSTSTPTPPSPPPANGGQPSSTPGSTATTTPSPEPSKTETPPPVMTATPPGTASPSPDASKAPTPTPSPTPSPSPTSTPGNPQTFQAGEAGLVTLRVSGRSIEVVSVQPNDGWTWRQLDGGQEITIRFTKGDERRLDFKATLEKGTISTTVDDGH